MSRHLDLGSRAVLTFDDMEGVPSRCAQTEPGVGRDNANVMDLSRRGTTEDQARIEDALERLVESDSRVLHVGVGNSSLASRFLGCCAFVDGITLSEAEREHADSLALARYRVALMNKYGPELAGLEGDYDFIVDNNPASFCCCMFHLEKMLERYAALLAPGGRVLTDREGMYWSYANRPLRLRFHHLEAIAAYLSLDAERVNDFVFALRRRETAPPPG